LQETATTRAVSAPVPEPSTARYAGSTTRPKRPPTSIRPSSRIPGSPLSRAMTKRLPRRPGGQRRPHLQVLRQGM